MKYFERFAKDNSPRPSFAHTSGVSVWERVGYANTEVRHIEWTSNTEFCLTVGNKSFHEVSVSVDEHGDASVLSITPIESCEYSEIKCDVPAVELPAVPGRRYLAKAKSAAKMKDGSILVGTEDTGLAKITGDKVFSFGQMTSAGGVHSLDVAPDGTVFGVAGHKEGCGTLFKYDGECGVTLLGIIPESFAENGRNVAIYRPKTLAVSPDEKHLAVGGADEISGAAVLKIN